MAHVTSLALYERLFTNALHTDHLISFSATSFSLCTTLKSSVCNGLQVFSINALCYGGTKIIRNKVIVVDLV